MESNLEDTPCWEQLWQQSASSQADAEEADVKAENSFIEGQEPKTGDAISTWQALEGASQRRDETDVRRQSAQDWKEDFEVDHGKDRANGTADDTTEPPMTANAASKNEVESEPKEESESSLLRVEAPTLGTSVPSSSPSSMEVEGVEEVPGTSRSSSEALRQIASRLEALCHTSVADAFKAFAGQGSDTLFIGTFTSVAHGLGMSCEEIGSTWRFLSGEKSFVTLQEWDGLLSGCLQASTMPAAPATPEESSSEEERESSSEEDWSTSTPGSTLREISETSSAQEEGTELQELQAKLKVSEEEKKRWQSEAHRQEEAAKELREQLRLIQAWGSIGSVQEIKRSGFGFIRPYAGPVHGKDLFFHKSELQKGNFQTLAIGDEVTYEVRLNADKKRTFAANVMLARCDDKKSKGKGKSRKPW